MPVQTKQHLLSKGKRIVSRNRKNPFIRKLAQYGATFHRWYENFDAEFYSNGEYFVLKALENQQFKTIFDVGANVGDWTRMAHGVFPDAVIHLFEIVPSTQRKLQSETKDIPNIVLNDFGLSDKAGEVSVNVFDEGDALSSVFDYPHPGANTSVVAHVETADSYVSSNNIEHVDLVKIDAEGMDYLVLAGMEKAIASKKIGVIQFEYGAMSIMTRFLLRNFYEFFKDYDYELGKIYPNHVEFRDYRFEHEDFLMSNYLAVSRERQDLIKVLS